MFGMVREPVETVLATEDPEMVPKKGRRDHRDLGRTAGVLAGQDRRVVDEEGLPRPVRWAMTPKSTK